MHSSSTRLHFKYYNKRQRITKVTLNNKYATKATYTQLIYGENIYCWYSWKRIFMTLQIWIKIEQGKIARSQPWHPGKNLSSRTMLMWPSPAKGRFSCLRWLHYLVLRLKEKSHSWYIRERSCFNISDRLSSDQRGRLTQKSFFLSELCFI